MGDNPVNKHAAKITSSFRPSYELKPLEDEKSVEKLLRAVRNRFVDTVDFGCSSFLDELIQIGVINQPDEDSLNGSHLPTRRERARRLWEILWSIDRKKFVSHVLPPLCQYYWFIIPDAFWLLPHTGANHTANPQGINLQGSGHRTIPQPSRHDRQRYTTQVGCTKCIRCAIEGRVRPADLGDILLRFGLLQPQTYRRSCSRHLPPDWALLFAAFKKLPRNDSVARRRVTRAMRHLLEDHSLSAEDELQTQLLLGFPCSCVRHRQQRPGVVRRLMPCLTTAVSDSSIATLDSLSSQDGLPYLRSAESMSRQDDVVSESASGHISLQSQTRSRSFDSWFKLDSEYQLTPASHRRSLNNTSVNTRAGSEYQHCSHQDSTEQLLSGLNVEDPENTVLKSPVETITEHSTDRRLQELRNVQMKKSTQDLDSEICHAYMGSDVHNKGKARVVESCLPSLDEISTYSYTRHTEGTSVKRLVGEATSVKQAASSTEATSLNTVLVVTSETDTSLKKVVRSERDASVERMVRSGEDTSLKSVVSSEQNRDRERCVADHTDISIVHGSQTLRESEFSSFDEDQPEVRGQEEVVSDRILCLEKVVHLRSGPSGALGGAVGERSVGVDPWWPSLTARLNTRTTPPPHSKTQQFSIHGDDDRKDDAFDSSAGDSEVDQNELHGFSDLSFELPEGEMEHELEFQTRRRAIASNTKHLQSNDQGKSGRKLGRNNAALQAESVYPGLGRPRSWFRRVVTVLVSCWQRPQISYRYTSTSYSNQSSIPGLQAYLFPLCLFILCSLLKYITDMLR